jgi:hypothetical protein
VVDEVDVEEGVDDVRDVVLDEELVEMLVYDELVELGDEVLDISVP